MNKKLILGFLLAVLTCSAYSTPVLAATKIELAPSSRVILRIAPGMSVDDIIARIYPNDRDLWPRIKEKLIEWNPASFHQYTDELISGSRLKLVDIKRIYEEDLAPKTRAGYVARMTGSATSRDINDRTTQLQINSRIFEGDRIETALDSTLFLIMDDGAELYLKPDSVIKISEYTITPGYDENSSSILDLLRGGLRKITGSIGNSALAKDQVQTGLATIGIRGTDYVIKLCKSDDCEQTVSRNDPDVKLHAVVLEGAITLTTDEEVQILMAMGEYGTATNETLLIEERVSIPSGFLNQQETQQFETTVAPVRAEPEEEASSSGWMWVIGALLLAVGL